MGHHRHKSKNKPLNLNGADKTILGIIATLICPVRHFHSLDEKNLAQQHAQDMLESLNGKARRVGEYLLNNLNIENDDHDKIRNYAHGLNFWASSLYEVSPT
jgi:hypothetical protein